MSNTSVSGEFYGNAGEIFLLASLPDEAQRGEVKNS